MDALARCREAALDSQHPDAPKGAPGPAHLSMYSRAGNEVWKWPERHVKSGPPSRETRRSTYGVASWPYPRHSTPVRQAFIQAWG